MSNKVGRRLGASVQSEKTLGRPKGSSNKEEKDQHMEVWVPDSIAEGMRAVVKLGHQRYLREAVIASHLAYLQALPPELREKVLAEMPEGAAERLQKQLAS